MNHLYWRVASTPSGDSDLVKAKWLSLENHVHNVHEHETDNFRECTHRRLRGVEANKEWFKRRKSFIQ